MRPVVWSIEAQRDNLEILRYIAEDNPFAAERVVDAIEDAGNKLGEPMKSPSPVIPTSSPMSCGT